MRQIKQKKAEYKRTHQKRFERSNQVPVFCKELDKAQFKFYSKQKSQNISKIAVLKKPLISENRRRRDQKLCRQIKEPFQFLQFDKRVKSQKEYLSKVDYQAEKREQKKCFGANKKADLKFFGLKKEQISTGDLQIHPQDRCQQKKLKIKYLQDCFYIFDQEIKYFTINQSNQRQTSKTINRYANQFRNYNLCTVIDLYEIPQVYNKEFMKNYLCIEFLEEDFVEQDFIQEEKAKKILLKLQFQEGEHKGKIFDIDQMASYIGRSDRCQKGDYFQDIDIQHEHGMQALLFIELILSIHVAEYQKIVKAIQESGFIQKTTQNTKKTTLLIQLEYKTICNLKQEVKQFSKQASFIYQANLGNNE